MKCRQFVDVAQPDILCRHSDAKCSHVCGGYAESAMVPSV